MRFIFSDIIKKFKSNNFSKKIHNTFCKLHLNILIEIVKLEI